MIDAHARPFAVVTGASSGIGLEIAKLAAEDGYDLLVVADEAKIEDAAEELRRFGGTIEAVEADLSTIEGVDALIDAIDDRDVAALVANAGRGLGDAFLDQDFEDARRVLDTNVTGTIYLLHRVGNVMRERGDGKILITGSIAGYIPGAFQAVYNGTKAFVDSFAIALRNELKDTGVSVTLLMPGATETEFFERAGMTDTKIGAGKKADPAGVAKDGWEAMKKGEADIVSGLGNKLRVAAASVVPATVMAEQHRKTAAPGSGRK
jgi:short-subunit dehydrogenase